MREERLSEVLRAAGDPVRVQLLEYLLDDEHCVTQCMEQTGLRQSVVSKHLGRLVAVGLVERRRAGRRSYHRVVEPERVRALLATAADLADAP